MRLNIAVMHFLHYPAKLIEVHFAGDMLHYVDPYTGELIAYPVYIAVLPFSGYSYLEALPYAKQPQVVKALNHTLDYFGGIPLGV
jgi:transposase